MMTFSVLLPANDNRTIKPAWMTPAEALQLVQQLRQEALRQGDSMESVERLQAWQEAEALERCIRWRYFGEL